MKLEPVTPEPVTPEPVTPECPRDVERPIMLQGWHDLASVHWAYNPELVQRLLPKGVQVDTYNGSAWVGLIPFHMRRIRLPGWPSFGKWSTFPETNVRTYVVAPDGRRAVWFFSLDISVLLPALVARVSYGLPYCMASMSITRSSADVIEYTAQRTWPRGRSSDVGPQSRLIIKVGEQVCNSDLTELEKFVTARWGLVSTFAGVPVWADVEHPPWVIHRSSLLCCEDTLLTATGLPSPTTEPFVLWSPGVEVRIGRPRRLSSLRQQ